MTTAVANVAVSPDSLGNLYVIGYQYWTAPPCPPMPTSQNAVFQSGDGYLLKFDSAGTEIEATDLPFSNADVSSMSLGLTVDSNNDPVVGFGTENENLPTSANAFQKAGLSSPTAYIAVLSPDLTEVLQATYLGGSTNTYFPAGLANDISPWGSVNELHYDANGNLFVLGVTTCSDYPVTKGAFLTSIPTYGAPYCQCLSEISHDFSSLEYSTFLTVTDPGQDYPEIVGFLRFSDQPLPRTMLHTNASFVVDSAGDAVISGYSPAPDFYIPIGSYATSYPSPGAGSSGYGVSATWLAKIPLQAGARLTLSTPAVFGGQTATGTIQLQAPAPAGGVSIPLTIYSTGDQYSPIFAFNPAPVSGPSSVTIPGGQSSASFQIQTGAVEKDSEAMVAASVGGQYVETCLLIMEPKITSATLTPNPVLSGQNVTVAVTVNHPAVSGANQVVVSSDALNGLTFNIPPGSTSGSGPTKVIGDAQSYFTTIAGPDGSVITLPLTVTSTVVPYAFTLNAAAIQGGASEQGTVRLDGPVNSSGLTVSLSSSNSSVASLPASFTAGSGATSFPVSITTSAVGVNTPVTLTASAGGFSASVVVTVAPPPPTNFYLSPATVTSGQGLEAVVQCAQPAGSSGNTYTLKSGSADVKVPATVTIPAGKTGVSFSITTSPVAANMSVGIQVGTAVTYKQAVLTLDAFPISNFYVSPASVVGGATTTGVIQIPYAAGSNGEMATLHSSSSLVKLPPSATIPEGAKGVSFGVLTSPVSTTETVTLTAVVGSASKNATVMLAPAVISNFFVSPSTLTGGSSTKGVVQLSGPAGPSGDVVRLSSGNPNVIVPATVTVPAETTGVSFTITTRAVTSATTVTLTATYGSSTKTATVTLNP